MDEVNRIGQGVRHQCMLKYQEGLEIRQQEMDFRKLMKTGATHRPAFSGGWLFYLSLLGV